MTFNLGPFAFQALHLLLMGAFIAALLAGRWAGRKHGVKVSPVLFDMAFAALVAGRIGFVALWFEQYRQAPLSILDIRDGGFDAWSAIAAALALAAWRAWRSRALREPLLVALLAGASAALIGGVPTQLRMGDAKKVPAIELRTATGQAVALAQLAQGKPMVVNLWATWCPPCRREMPVLAAAQERNPDIVFVFANQGEDAETVSAYLSADRLAMRNVLLDPAKAAGLAAGSTALPTTLFYDRSGTLVERHLGPLSAATLAAKMTRLRPTAAPTSP